MAEKKPAAPAPPSKTDQLIAALESGQFDLGAPSDIPRPIGPPEHFYTSPEQAQRYEGFQVFRDGDQWTPGGWNREDRALLQSKLNALGLYGSQGYVPGRWGDDDARAYGEVLSHSNATKLDPIDALADMAQQRRVDSPRTTSPRAPLVVDYANPETVRQIVRKSAYDLIGRRLSDDEEARIIGGFQSQYTGAQQAEYAAGAGAGGSFTQPQGPEGYAEAQIEQQYAPEVAQQRHISAFEEILGKLGTLVPAPNISEGGGVS